MRFLSLDELATRVDTSLSLLSGSGRGATPRYQTLCATIEWSYQLLTDREAALLRRVSIFAGGWTLEAAESICADETIPHTEILDLLSRLVDKSLVTSTTFDRTARFNLLRTIRQYGKEKLYETGEGAEVSGRHAGFFLELAEEIAPGLNSMHREALLTILDFERDNFRVAFQQFADTHDNVAELKLCQALFFYWFYRGQWSEGRRRLDEALTRSGGHGDTSERARSP